MTSPMKSSGVVTSTDIIGSRMRAGLTCAVLERHGSGDLEGKFGRVNVVVRTVEQCDLDVNHGVTGQNTVLHALWAAASTEGCTPAGIRPPVTLFSNR